MSHILIFGAGFLGRRLAEQIPGACLSPEPIGSASAERDIRRRAADVVVNAAGKTGKPNVDWCETHQEETYSANVIGALSLASACARAGVHLIHLGSGCIFYRRSPHPDGAWREDDAANPGSFYSRSKYAADLVLSRLPNVAVVRLRMPIDGWPHDRNLITKLARYREVVDVENSATVVDDLAEVVRLLAEKRATGVFHATNPGTVRHRDLMALYRKHVDPAHEYTLIPEADLVARGLVARARSNCILASTRLAEYGIAMPPIGERLPETVRRYAEATR